MSCLGVEMSNLSEFQQLNAVLQQAESIDHFDALKHCLLSCDLSLDLSDMTIEQNKQRRGLSHSKLKGHQYLVQLADVQIHPTYVFAPLISAALNRATAYIAVQDSVMQDIYRHYFNTEATQLEKQRALTEMHLSFDFLPSQLNTQQLVIYALCKALMDPGCQQIYLLGDHTVSEQLITEFTVRTGITIDRVTVEPIQEKSQIIDFGVLELNKLFWKKKSEHLAQACQYIAQDNASLIGLQFGIDEHYAAHLIDDLLYGEHIFEKISVFGEFTETILKHHLEMSRQAEQVA